MLENAKRVSDRIADMEEPLLRELNEGISIFVQEFDEFNRNFEANGPMVDGISAKEAKDWVEYIKDLPNLAPGDALTSSTVLSYQCYLSQLNKYTLF
ncbi:hypothetical protein ACLKA6_008645 [Drosophila palustris]